MLDKLENDMIYKEIDKLFKEIEEENLNELDNKTEIFEN
jgi:hypothetical protein